MASHEYKENLNKLTYEQLEELLERETNLAKNSKILQKLPDNGEKIKQWVSKIEKELKFREEVKSLEKTMSTLTIIDKNDVDGVSNDKHTKHICSMEKTPEKERYKPSATRKANEKAPFTKDKHFISLTESVALLAGQINKTPLTVEKLKEKIEGDEKEETNDEQKFQDAIELD